MYNIGFLLSFVAPVQLLFPLLNSNLKSKIYYINSQNAHTEASIVIISRNLTYTNGFAELDISDMNIKIINPLNVNVIGSSVTYGAIVVSANSGTALRAILNNTSYNGDLYTIFTVLCSR